jgi:hypothetical protein
MNSSLGAAGEKNPYRTPNPNYKQDVFRLVDRPNVGYPSADLALWASEYRGFQIVRESEQTTFFKVLNLDGSEPPVKLRGSFTAKMRAEQMIDDFIIGEQSKEPNANAESVHKDYPA